MSASTITGKREADFVSSERHVRRKLGHDLRVWPKQVPRIPNQVTMGPSMARDEAALEKDTKANDLGKFSSLWQSTMHEALTPNPSQSPHSEVESYYGAPKEPICGFTSNKERFDPPLVPPVGLLNIMANYDHANLDPYIGFLKSIGTPVHELNEIDKQHKSPLQEPRSTQYSAWLLSLLPRRRPTPLIRSLILPAANDLSALARCIRFVNSPAEKKFPWAVHPTHFALIMGLTNGYGGALCRDVPKKKQLDLETMELRDVRRLLELEE